MRRMLPTASRVRRWSGALLGVALAVVVLEACGAGEAEPLGSVQLAAVACGTGGAGGEGGASAACPSDGDLCTDEVCNEQTGFCESVQKEDCCNLSSECDDGHSCTTDTCDEN